MLIGKGLSIMRKREIRTQNMTNSKDRLVLKKYVYIYRKYRYMHR